MSLRKTFIKTFEDNDCSPTIFKEMITKFRSLSNDPNIKIYLNKKQYQKEHKKEESERIKDFLSYIMTCYSSIYSDVFSTSEQIIELLNDVFQSGSYNKIIDSINRLFFPKEKSEDDDVLSELISLMPMKYYGQKVKEMNFTCKETNADDYFKEITNNENSICLTDNDKYVLLFLNEQETEKNFDFDSSQWNLVKEHYYSFDSMKRCSSTNEIKNMMMYLHLNTYVGEYKYNCDYQEITDELKIRNNISSLPTKYEDVLGSIMCIFKYASSASTPTKELKIYFTCSTIPSDINNDFTCKEIDTMSFIDEYFNRTDVLYSLG